MTRTNHGAGLSWTASLCSEKFLGAILFCSALLRFALRWLWIKVTSLMKTMESRKDQTWSSSPNKERRSKQSHCPERLATVRGMARYTYITHMLKSLPPAPPNNGGTEHLGSPVPCLPFPWRVARLLSPSST